jgi:hypothetical protein
LNGKKDGIVIDRQNISISGHLIPSISIVATHSKVLLSSIASDVKPLSTANATSAAISIAQMLSSTAHPTPETEQSPHYEVRNIPGKGKGLIATRKISAGQVFREGSVGAVILSRRVSNLERRFWLSNVGSN